MHSLLNRRPAPGVEDYIATKALWNGGMLPNEAGSMRAFVWLGDVVQERDMDVHLP